MIFIGFPCYRNVRGLDDFLFLPQPLLRVLGDFLNDQGYGLPHERATRVLHIVVAGGLLCSKVSICMINLIDSWCMQPSGYWALYH